MFRKILLYCGIAAPILYVLTVIAGAALCNDYSHIINAVSELISNGAPNKAILDVIFNFYGALLLAFAIGGYITLKNSSILCRVAIFGLGEPMHLDVPIPPDLAPVYTQNKGVGPEGWAKCFATVEETAEACRQIGFGILEAGNAPDGWYWWDQFSRNDPYCKSNPEGEARIIQQDGGRWLAHGYVIARKPA